MIRAPCLNGSMLDCPSVSPSGQTELSALETKLSRTMKGCKIHVYIIYIYVYTYVYICFLLTILVHMNIHIYMYRFESEVSCHVGSPFGELEVPMLVTGFPTIPLELQSR